MSSIVGLHVQNYEGRDPMLSHAWISVTENGKTETYGLYPPDCNRVTRADATPHGGPDSNVFKGLDDDRMEKVATDNKNVTSTYHEMTPQDKEQLVQFLEKDQKWEKYENNCAHFASDAYASAGGKHYEVTGTLRDIEGTEQKADCPQGLRDAIRNDKIKSDAPAEEAKSGGAIDQSSGIGSKFMAQPAPSPAADFNAPPPPPPPPPPDESKSLTEEFNNVR